MEEGLVISHTDRRDALSNLHDGAWSRLRSAAWTAQKLCEEITHDRHNPLEVIQHVRDVLDQAAEHARALRFYRSALDRELAVQQHGETVNEIGAGA